MFRRIFLGVAKRSLKYAGIPLRDPALVAIFGRNDVTSGVNVNEDTALNFSAVFSAVNLISSTLGMMPCRLRVKHGKKLPGHMVPAEQHVVNMLVAIAPNDYATPIDFFQSHQAHVLTHGNAYIQIDRVQGVPVALATLLPDQVRADWTKEGAFVYMVNRRDEAGKWEWDVVLPEDMIHVKGLGYDTLGGYSVIQRAREAVGLGIAAEVYGAGFFGRGAVPGGVLKHPGELTDTAKNNILRDWEDRHRNSEGGSRVAILEEGMTYAPTSIPPEDAQFLQTRQFQVVEIARWFRVPPFMLYEAVAATFNNTEQQGKDFLTYTLWPYLQKWQQELARKLLTEEEQEYYEFYHDPAILLMPDMMTRYAAYAMGRNGGWDTLNDIMRAEGRALLPADVGDARLRPATMQVVGNDPTTPIDPVVMQAAIALITALPAPPDANTATMILDAVMPTTDDALVKALVANLTKSGKVTA